MKSILFSFFLLVLSVPVRADIDDFSLPEFYQDILVRGRVVKKGVRGCFDRYLAIKPVLETLPKNFKSLDIGASQGYFSFKMAQEYQARCTMVEEGYSTSQKKWRTGELLHYLCQENSHLDNIFLLQKKMYAEDLLLLSKSESFDIVLALSVVHHMRKNTEESNDVYVEVVDNLLKLAPVVIVENPVNTGPHTEFIRKILQERGGEVIYSTERGTLVYETYLFQNASSFFEKSLKPDLSFSTYRQFNGTFNSFKPL